MDLSLPLVAFAVGFAAESVNLVGIASSALGWTKYWPPGERGWRYYTHWTLEQTFNVSLLVVTYFGWNSLGFPTPALVAGAVCFAVPFAGALLAGRGLGSEETMGLEGELRTGGWYRYSRNPQYVCYVVATVGFAVFAATPPVFALCAVYLLSWVTLPFAEEPWLREQYGEAYERYAQRVPRFVGPASVRALADRRSAADAE
ncbi:isoprenylcysteine carboxylmethyltransferase family protein [Halomicroarcula limicola]|uniref:Isoprenylcysteine carboxylmethyltransferase family protein n=1 Tax=Haloarcula limicola TaxID=1429915 RepID=A0A8J7Y516_9EURY|nr:isoprenylcysteine carboxylmethyltransferase family protein [Halomicroarcula limicola]MBV0924377.1 isoprenylcysteine carboxylmethyltransferase family protein [Halomicroarcula limicola]